MTQKSMGPQIVQPVHAKSVTVSTREAALVSLSTAAIFHSWSAKRRHFKWTTWFPTASDRGQKATSLLHLLCLSISLPPASFFLSPSLSLSVTFSSNTPLLPPDLSVLSDRLHHDGHISPFTEWQAPCGRPPVPRNQAICCHREKTNTSAHMLTCTHGGARRDPTSKKTNNGEWKQPLVHVASQRTEPWHHMGSSLLTKQPRGRSAATICMHGKHFLQLFLLSLLLQKNKSAIINLCSAPGGVLERICKVIYLLSFWRTT